MSDDKYQKLIRDGKQYVRMRYDLLRLELLEKMSRILAVILLIIVATFLILAAFIYFTFAIVAWLQPMLGTVVPLCIVGGFFVLLLLILILLRKKLFVNPIISILSGILFDKNPQIDENEAE